MSDGVAQNLWILPIGTDNYPWGQYQPLIPNKDIEIKNANWKKSNKKYNGKTKGMLKCTKFIKSHNRDKITLFNKYS
jgi:hypothetical protein